MKGILLQLFALLFLTGCYEINTTSPKDVYKHWSGSYPHDDLKVSKAQYWRSAHWTKEYIMYLKFKPSNKWWEAFIKQNKLRTECGKWVKPEDCPSWFSPNANSIMYCTTNEFDQESIYIQDKVTGYCFIYEVQL